MALVADGELTTPFAQVSNAVALPDGRVMFAETKDRLLFVGDFTTGRADTLGRRVDTATANAPADVYKYPGWVARYAGGTVAVVDFAALRLTLWSATAQPLRAIAFPPLGSATPILAYDTLARGYKADYRAAVGGGEPGTPFRPDSLPLLRVDLDRSRMDTLGHLAAPSLGDARFGEQTQQVPLVFGPNDAYGALADGSVWIARARTKSVDWRDPNGRWTRGPAREYDRVPVTAQDRERVMARLREHGLPAGVSVAYPFAETKPAFELALGRPSGEVWLQRPRAEEREGIVYDVVGRDGRWVREVRAPAGVAVIGFDDGDRVYATRPAAGGKKTVGRYRLR